MKSLLLVTMLALIPALTSGSNASLSVLQNGVDQRVVLDSANNEIWYWDLSTFANLTYAQQLADIQQLNVSAYFGSTGWHLAKPAEMQPLWLLDSATIRANFNPTEVLYSGYYEWHYWSGRYESGSGGTHQGCDTAWGNFYFGPFDYSWPETYSLSDAAGYADYGGAWVVSAAPEPTPPSFSAAAVLCFCCCAGRLAPAGR
jgi:hypothetical protein